MGIEMTNEEFSVAIAAKITHAREMANSWVAHELYYDDEGINPAFDEFIGIMMVAFRESVAGLVLDEVIEDDHFDMVAEAIIRRDFDAQDHTDYFNEMREELRDEWLMLYDPEGFYGVSSEFTLT